MVTLDTPTALSCVAQYQNYQPAGCEATRKSTGACILHLSVIFFGLNIETDTKHSTHKQIHTCGDMNMNCKFQTLVIFLHSRNAYWQVNLHTIVSRWALYISRISAERKVTYTVQLFQALIFHLLQSYQSLFMFITSDFKCMYYMSSVTFKAIVTLQFMYPTFLIQSAVCCLGRRCFSKCPGFVVLLLHYSIWTLLLWFWFLYQWT
jgi:hypothetical protein